MKRTLLVIVLLLGSFQLGRLSERASMPCRVRPVAKLLAPLMGKEMPSKEVCDLILKIPQF
ncbi:hypothetical protein NZK27_12050 [Synechococcus sp. FGCU-3]|nr:hypothetical protein [Synechococcus sp. FGCU3]